MYKIGLSTCGKIISEELFANYQRAGIDAMEISVGSAQCDLLNYREIKAFAQSYGVDLWSFHLPFEPFEKIDISRAELAKYSVAYFSELIKKASDIGIDKFVVHSSGEPIDEQERPERFRQAQESIMSLADIAQQNGAIIAVENLPRTCLGKNSDEIKALVGNHKAVKVCFDTNHLLEEDPAEFIKNVGEKIITIHVSDYDFVNERHWLPGEGKLDWNKILQSLESVKYNGVWMYELGFDCPKTIFRERKLVCEDFAENARALFEGKKPPCLSSPL